MPFPATRIELVIILASLWLHPTEGGTTTATIYNDRPRLDVNGDYIDAHSGTIVAVPNSNGSTTYYLYGESNGNQTGKGSPIYAITMPTYAMPMLCHFSHR